MGALSYQMVLSLIDNGAKTQISSSFDQLKVVPVFYLEFSLFKCKSPPYTNGKQIHNGYYTHPPLT